MPSSAIFIEPEREVIATPRAGKIIGVVTLMIEKRKLVDNMLLNKKKIYKFKKK